MQFKKLLGSVAAAVAACGIAFADAPATAVWTGGGNRSVITDPANWQCFDAGGNEIAGAIPDASTTAVAVAGETTFNCPEGQPVIWNSLTVSGTVTLAADCDWRGVGQVFGGFVAADTTLNVKGHKLYVKVADGGTNRRINVTDDSPDGSGGEFHIDVPEGATFGNTGGWGSNDAFWFSGSVEVVKDGKGAYVPNYANGGTGLRYYQHTGGTTIHEGLLYLSNDAEGTKNETYYAQNTRPVFGAYGSSITIEAGATFDYKGIYDISNYKMYINGGTFMNTRMPARPDYGANGAIDFGADSYIDIARTAHISGPFLLHGHTLTATIAADQIWYCRYASATDGTIKLEGDGVCQIYFAEAIATDNVTYDVNCALDVVQPISVSNYVARYEGESNAGTADFKVYGTFTPVTDRFYPATMQNGSTIDLSGKSAPWPLSGAFGTLKFAASSSVTLDVGARRLVDGEKVVTWTQIPESVAFRITGTAIAPTESARIAADGVYYDVPDAGVVAVAHWTGEGAHNDFNDPANWTCTNMLGELAPGAIPGERSNVYLGILNFDVADAAAVAKLSTYQSVMLEPPMTLTADCDWRGLSANDSLFSGVTIHLAGHSLRLTCPNGTSQCAFTVTDDAETGGSFVADVPDGALFENTLISIGGTAALVKEGAGTFMPHRYDQPYTGGTAIAAGTLKLFNDDVANSSTFSPGKAGYKQPLGVEGSIVRVEAGAFYDINGIYDTYLYPVMLAGGTLTNSKQQTQYSWGGIGPVALEADSTIDVVNHTVVFANSVVPLFDLNGHTLFVNFSNPAEAKHLYLRNVVATNGTIKASGEGWLDVNGGLFEARTIALDANASLLRNGDIVVSNYVARYAGNLKHDIATYFVQVYGRFTPVADRFNPVKLHDGATIDLSELSGVMQAVTAHGAMLFEDATNITIDVGARVLQNEEQLIAWDAAPAGVTFALEGDNVQEGDSLCVIENGVFYNVAADSRLVTRASWTGQAGDGDISNSGNWTCWNAYEREVVNGVPGASAKVHVAGAFGAGIPTAAAMPWQRVTFGNLNLADDMDMRGLTNFFACVYAASTIDLRGHRLFVNVTNGNPPEALTVTDSTAAAPGELHVAVPSGATFSNNRVTLSGNVKLVKEGAGVFVPQVFKVAYSGGNVVAEGMLTLYNDGTADSSTYAFGQPKNPNPLGVYGVPVVVEEGATLDINGNYDTSLQHFTLNGGTIANSKAQSKTGWGSFGNVSLTADSSVNVGNNLVSVAPYNLGGHTLECSIASGKVLYLKADITDGTLKTTGEGTLQTIGAAGSATMDLDVSTPLNVGADVTARNYTARYEGTANAGAAAINVYGTFTPVTDKFYGCTMQNGSTLDLIAKTDIWSTKGAFESGLNAVTFAENAVVKVALSADRELNFDDNGLAKVVAWEESPPQSTQFKLTGPAVQNRRALLKRPDGLYIMKLGVMIIFR